MATVTRPASSQEQTPEKTPEQALCAIFDLVEDELEKLTPQKRKAWLQGLSATAESLKGKLSLSPLRRTASHS